VACPLNCKCRVACHPVPFLCNVPRAQKDALRYADSMRDKHGANYVTPLCPDVLSSSTQESTFTKLELGQLCTGIIQAVYECLQ
jgi:hypothetical protein